MKVLIVCEDPTHDPFIVRPIVEALLEEVGLTANSSVLTDPHLRGIDDVLKQLAVIADDNRMADLIVVVADNDCDREHNAARLDHACKADPRIVACCAIEEVETWLLALHREGVEKALGLKWPEVRAHCDPKEHIAVPFLRHLGDRGPGRGRKAAMRQLGRSWRGLCTLCPEIGDLGDRIRAVRARLS